MKNFKLDDRVEFHSTTSIDLDGKQGTILGFYADHTTNKFWIVLLDNPLPDWRAIVMTDSCLKKVE